MVIFPIRMHSVPLISFVAFLTASLLMAGCELSSSLEEDDEPITGIRFSRDVLPVLEQKCASCHASAVEPGPAVGLSLESWELLIRGSDFGEVVIPFAAERSLLVRMVSNLEGGVHPTGEGAQTLTASELERLREWISEGARSDAGVVPFSDAENLLYVCNQEDATVGVVDTDLNVVVRLVDLREFGFSSSAMPHHVAVEPDGSAWYVSLIGDNVVARFDRDNNLEGVFTFETPGMLALDPKSDWLYVGRSLSAPDPPQSVGRIRRSDMSGEEIPVVFPRPHALVVGPEGQYVYSASLGANQLIVIRSEDDEVSFTPVSGQLHSFVQHAVSPDGSLLASSAQLTSSVIFFDLADPAQPSQIWSTGTNARPWHPSFSVDGNWLFVGNLGANTVSFISIANRRVESIVTGGGLAEPHGSFVSADGLTLYVSNRNTDETYVPRHDFGDNSKTGTIAVIDIPTRQIVKVLEVGRFAAGMAGRAR